MLLCVVVECSFSVLRRIPPCDHRPVYPVYMDGFLIDASLGYCKYSVPCWIYDLELELLSHKSTLF